MHDQLPLQFVICCSICRERDIPSPHSDGICHRNIKNLCPTTTLLYKRILLSKSLPLTNHTSTSTNHKRAQIRRTLTTTATKQGTMSQANQVPRGPTVGTLQPQPIQRNSQNWRGMAERREPEEASHPVLLVVAPPPVRMSRGQRRAHNRRQRAALRQKLERQGLTREAKELKRELAQLRRDFERYRARIDGDQVGNSGLTAEE